MKKFMKTIKTPIIPRHQTFVEIKDQPHELDYKAICVFSALGFFLDTDTYWKDKKVFCLVYKIHELKLKNSIMLTKL